MSSLNQPDFYLQTELEEIKRDLETLKKASAQFLEHQGSENLLNLKKVLNDLDRDAATRYKILFCSKCKNYSHSTEDCERYHILLKQALDRNLPESRQAKLITEDKQQLCETKHTCPNCKD